MESNLPASQGLTEKQQKFLDFIPHTKTLNEAARRAGYTDKTATNIRYLINKSPKLRLGIKQLYLNNNISQLHTIMNIEESILKSCNENIDQVPKFKDTIKQIKQQAGVLQSDMDYNKPSQTLTLNVRDILVQINEAQPQDIKGLGAPSADVIDVKGGDNAE